jgi:hypothetical protein
MDGPRHLERKETFADFALFDLPTPLTAHRRRLGMKNPLYDHIQARKVKARLAFASYWIYR